MNPTHSTSRIGGDGAPGADAEALAEALEEVAREGSAPETCACVACTAVRVYRAKHPTSVGKSGDATTKPASELERGPKETT